MSIRKIVLGVVVFGVGPAAYAQGFFDFGDIPGADQQPVVDVNLNSVMIGFAAAMIRPTDPTTADMLSGLRGMRLQVYEAVKNPNRVAGFIDDVTKKLEKDGWQRVVFVQNDDAKVRIHLQMTEKEVSGMTVMAFDHGEAIFINIAGTVSAADLGTILAKLPTLPTGAADVLSSMPLPTGSAVAAPVGD